MTTIRARSVVGALCLLVPCLVMACSSQAESVGTTASQLPSCADTPTTGESRVDLETGYAVQGNFLERYLATGGVAGVGRPVTDVFESIGADGYPYETQCFERRVYEYHPYTGDCRWRVLGRHVGRAELARRYGDNPPAGDVNPSEQGERDPETGKVMGSRMLEHWKSTGGLDENGRPITDEIVEEENGMRVRTQYFERAVFEYHPDNAHPYDVLGRLLGLKDADCRARIAQLESPAPQGAPPKGPPPGWDGIDRDGCGHDGKPRDSCNAGDILRKIGEDPAEAVFETVGCVSCAYGLIKGGKALRGGAGELKPTSSMRWKTDVVENGTAAFGCGACVKYMSDIGLFSTTKCLVDSALSDGCTFDQEGATNVCKNNCLRDFDQYGFVNDVTKQCNCTDHHREMECGFKCSVGQHMDGTHCQCLD